MKNLSETVKNKLIARYIKKDTPKIQPKSTDINILLNRVRLNQKNEFKKKIVFFCNSINRLSLIWNINFLVNIS